MSQARQFTEEAETLLNISDDSLSLSYFPTAMKLQNSHLSECPCGQTGVHNRKLPGNTRCKIENIIIQHAAKGKQADPIHILSMGAGGLLQELLIVLRLIKSGRRSIHLTMVDPKSHQKAYQDLQAYFGKLMNVVPGLQLTCEQYNAIDQLNLSKEKPSYDIVYAIDYEDIGEGAGNDFSNRALFHREGHFTDKSYIAMIDLIKAITYLKQNDQSLGILSRGQDIACLTSAVKSQFKEYEPLSKMISDNHKVSAFYINANLFPLIQEIDYFRQQNKPVLINQNIIDPLHLDAMETFLSQYSIEYRIIREDSLIASLKPFQERGVVVVADYTMFDTNRCEPAISNDLNKRNVSLVRQDCQLVRQERQKGNHFASCSTMSLYPTLERANKNRWVLKSGDNDVYQAIDKRILASLFDIKDIKERKDKYLKALQQETNLMAGPCKKEFAAYLLSNPCHLLRIERHCFRSQPYSVQTCSFQKAMVMLMGDNFTTKISRGEILINHESLSRHVSSLTRQ